MATAQEALRNVFGAPGLQQFMPQPQGLAEILGQLGIQVPQGAGLSGLTTGNLDIAQKALNIGKGLNQLNQQSPTTSNFFNDPGKVASVVMDLWHTFSKIVQEQGGTPPGLNEFVANMPFSNDIKQMYSVLFSGSGDGQPGGAQAALGGALGQ